MSRLTFLMGLFLSMTVTGIVFLLSVLANTPLSMIVSRCLIVFLLFGTLGVILGSALEVLVMPEILEREISDIQKRLNQEDTDNTLSDLGDLLDSSFKQQEEIKIVNTQTDNIETEISELFDEDTKT